jgi:hypothetical protein
MKVYLAAPYTARDLLRSRFVPDLEEDDHECTSSWLKETHTIASQTVGPALGQSVDYALKHVMQDIHDVTCSHVLVLFTESYCRQYKVPPPYNTGGRHVETGIAMANHIPVVVLGEPENIFHRVEVIVENWMDVLKYLSKNP